jgi:hypothetical protein
LNTKRNYNRIISDLALILCIVFLISCSLFSGSAKGNIVKNADKVYIQFLPRVFETNTNLKKQTIFGCCSYHGSHNIQVTFNKVKQNHPSSFSLGKPRPRGIPAKQPIIKDIISSEDCLYYPELIIKCFPPEYTASLSFQTSPAYKVRPPPYLMH